MARQHNVDRWYARVRVRSVFSSSIASLLVLRNQLVLKVQGHVIVGLRHSVLGNMLDEPPQVYRVHLIMLPVRVNPAVRSRIA
jgi:hypothetical protein